MAVALVVLYHARIPFVTGGFVGVDVFFVISGFLITNHLLAALDRDGRVRFLAFYAKRAMRILPASFVVLGLTLGATATWLPPLQWRSTLQEAAATALYAPNVLFAVKNTDYLADTTPSVFQHYWSLGVEEQFYLVWPAVLAVTFWAFGRSHRQVAWLLGGLVVVSLAACVVLTQTSQPWAFFLLPTRAWELGVGGILAVVMPGRKRLPGVATATVGTLAGLGALTAAALLYSDSTTFPGLTVTLPVAGAVAVIYFGAHAAAPAARILTNAPMTFIGAISYSLYLVHWPLLVIPEQAGGVGRELSLGITALIALLAVPVAYALYRFVEEPARNYTWLRQRPRGAVVIALGTSMVMAASAVAGLYAFRYVPLDAGRPAAPVSLATPPVFTAFVPSNVSPSLASARNDNPAIYASGCHANFVAVEPVGCTFGAARNNAPEVVLFGDSHAAQWFPALELLADVEHISLRVETKSGCPSVEVLAYHDGSEYTACAQWRDNVIATLRDDPPDTVVISNYAQSYGVTESTDSANAWGLGLERVQDQLGDSTRVVVIADTPTFESTPSVCLSAHLDDTTSCARSRATALNTQTVRVEMAAIEGRNSEYLDLTDYICDSQLCGTVTGNVLMYRDDNHLTATFAASFSSLILSSLL